MMTKAFEVDFQYLSFEDELYTDVPYVVITPQSPTIEGCLEALVSITGELHPFIGDHPDIDEEEPWFGWVFNLDGEIINENALLNKAHPDVPLHDYLVAYLNNIIACSALLAADVGLYVHDSKEMGSDVARFLLNSHPEQYMDLYIDFLKSIDLEHTVAQEDTLRMLMKQLNPEQKERFTQKLKGCTNAHQLVLICG